MNTSSSAPSPPHDDEAARLLPRAPIDRWLHPLRQFLRIEAASGVVLLICTIIALLMTNSSWSEAYLSLWEVPIGLRVGEWRWHESLGHWINDGLMTIFFFVVGLEIKRELVIGELRDPRNAALPIIGALGGMVVPAAIYWMLQRGQPGERGWAIPMATDIAFAVGILGLLGSRAPAGLKIFLLSLAIADDLGAIVVIAAGYSKGISADGLIAAAIGFGILIAQRWLGVRRMTVYVPVGVGIWIAVLKSGIHPTVAGVLIAFVTPTRAWVRRGGLRDSLARILRRVSEGDDGEPAALGYSMSAQLARVAMETVSPVQRLEHALHPWVAFVIMPLFALANAGVVVQPNALWHPVAVATSLGLIVGKPVGVVLFSWLAVQLRLARLPAGVDWKLMWGAGCLAGIGFTMSLFISSLAFTDELLDAGKIGTLLGSTVSAVLGFGLLRVGPSPSSRGA